MVSVTHSISQSASALTTLELLCEGLSPEECERVSDALQWVESVYGNRTLGTQEPVFQHALGTALIVASLRLDVDSRVAALAFAVGDVLDHSNEQIAERYGDGVARLVDGLRRLNGLRVITRMTTTASAPEIRAQSEVLRKMLLAMVEDIRVVLLRVASRTQTLRYFTDHPGTTRDTIARESLDIYAPLANRLGLWQLKWELEDLSFRFLEPETYKRIARMLDERRVEREQFIVDAVARLKAEVEAIGVQAEVYGRPKHIFSIYNKMRSKRLDFSQIYDVRALRVLVREVKECYAVLGIVHQIWTPIPKEFDDYISMPKGNNYQSLHTAVYAGDGRALEVQIRTHDMHNHAELGVAAHWRYKEGSGPASGEYDEKIALLRSLLSWRDEVTDSADWLEQFKRASLDDTIYVLTPQGRVIDLPRGATPIDFAYRVHTDLGHRCRGAKVNGQLVTLNTPLESGQTVEIMTTKEGGPSRDWLNVQQRYVATHRARQKIKQYFNTLEEEELLVRGRSVLTREIQREGHGQVNLDDLATRLGFKGQDALFVAAGRGEVGPRAIQTVLRGSELVDHGGADPEVVLGQSHSGDAGDTILIVGVGKLMTSLGRCCKPAPPDAIQGYVTRGRGVSIHRLECRDFQQLARSHPERLVSAQWGGAASPGSAVFPVDVVVHSLDRQGLLRDISEVLSREKLNVIAVNTLSRKGAAKMRFTLEVQGVQQIQRALILIREVKGVTDVERG
ncbi:bifunctional (p)ppGpp synthetase/guanosine-3',5'-bis(diphosphate) 3'-pyrophosphohydrolase [Zoogloea sp.]|uniref:RelA/SpoT family protein n=1 Tax=Zoogloea sp. TaxID=49181 RepID=UPI0026052ED8|nr:bifunctional (p)ppGpp synthetase/guanosine-3',5'-bis(diphosphate) 3'-pyrophosphohydrolase [Zoogloea sp.]MDD3354470.1 bifunctional (p)ppGpp synthetase/guanosine-3',5'-bis(diphosphate) 3'-pyrophosphohydrolase [Zoogloea sp.]